MDELKTLIILCHTSRVGKDYLTSLDFRNNGKYDRLPNYVILKDGSVVETLSPKESSEFLEDDKLSKKSIVVCLENLGWVNKNLLSTTYSNWLGDKITDVHERKWRNKYFWDKYSDEQLKSLVELCNKLCEEFNIPKKFVGHNTKLNGVLMMNNNQYDEIKDLLKRSRLLTEQPIGAPNIGADIEDKIDQDEQKTPKDQYKKYRVSGGILVIHGSNATETSITTDDKTTFQETMDEFVSEVSDLVDFGPLNLYKNSVEWSGKIIDHDIEFFMTIGEQNGVYINGNQLKLDEKFMDTISKLTGYYEKFKSKWAKVIAGRKKTSIKEN
jgi:hypothetical protein